MLFLLTYEHAHVLADTQSVYKDGLKDRLEETYSAAHFFAVVGRSIPR